MTNNNNDQVPDPEGKKSGIAGRLGNEARNKAHAGLDKVGKKAVEQASTRKMGDAVAKKLGDTTTQKVADKAGKKLASKTVDTVTKGKDAVAPHAKVVDKTVRKTADKVLRRKESDKNTGDGAVKDVLTEAGAGAASGAVTGGAVGAGIGAGVGAGKAVLKNKKLQRFLLILLLIPLLAPLIAGAAAGIGAASIMGAISMSQEENSVEAAEKSDVERDRIAEANHLSETLNNEIPWQMVLAIGVVTERSAVATANSISGDGGGADPLIDNADSLTVVVNKSRPLTPADYTPADLYTVDGTDVELSQPARQAVEDLLEAADEEKYQITVSDGFRTFSEQEQLHKNDTSRMRAGYSEHQTGLLVKLSPAGDDEGEVRDWIQREAVKHGLIQRYPATSSAVTGHPDSPDMWRFVGIEVAEEMRDDQARTLEEWFGLPPVQGYADENSGPDTGTPNPEYDKDKNWDYTKLVKHLGETDPEKRYRDLAIIATYSEAGRDRLGRDIKSPEDGGDPAAWEHHETAKEIYVDGMTAAGLTEDEAEEAFDMALSWVLGRAVDQCQADTTGTDTDIIGEADGGGVGALSSDQVANAKTIIGMAKGMAGDNWEHAAVIGVMTAFQESRLLVYANDGEFGKPSAELSHTDTYPESAYKIVKKSLDYPHQRVGTDHLSLGIFQQNVNLHWTSLGDKNFENDPEGSIERGMDPAFNSFKFFEALMKNSSWVSGDPVAESHRVQGSAHPDAPKKFLPLAKDFVAKYGGSVEKLSPPDKDWKPGGQASAENCDEMFSMGSDVLGGFAHPLGKPTTWSSYNDREFLGAAFFPAHTLGAVDMHAPLGSPIFAIADGVVIMSENYGGLGNWVRIKHSETLWSGYAHQASLDVRVGQRVKAGQRIGSIGMTGITSGPHLHLETGKNPNKSQFDVRSPRVRSVELLRSKGIKVGQCVSGPRECGYSQGKLTKDP